MRRKIYKSLTAILLASTMITQVDVDLYSIDGKERTLEDIIKYFVITDYGEKNSLKIDNWTQNLHDSVYSEMQEDSELTE